MSKSTFTAFLTLLIILIVGVSAWYIIDNYSRYTKHVEEQEEVLKEEQKEEAEEEFNTVVEDAGVIKSVNEYQFKDEFGSGQKMITIKAIECDRLSGFTGASSNVYCVTGNKELIHLELVNLTNKVVATNIDMMEVNSNGVLAYYKGNYSAKVEDGYVTYVEKD
jgi:hypothetical protein